MPTKRNRNIQLAHAVLDWNRKNLRHDARLTQDVIKECFGDRFVVEPNGRHYQADPAAYLEFLNGMKQSMLGIDYQVTHTVADEEFVVFDMRVQMDHVDGRREHFVAMLLMKFDDQGKVSLWKEVYLGQPLESSTAEAAR